MHLFVVGFMGAGKSTVGQVVAEKLALPFCDLDKEIEKECGCSISELFQSKGEDSFRLVETMVLREHIAKPSQVISVGGGTFCGQANREAMMESGFVVWLTASRSTFARRLKGSSQTRPLLAQQDWSVMKAKRQSDYAMAHTAVASDVCNENDTASAVCCAWEQWQQLASRVAQKTTVVTTRDCEYPVVIDEGALDALCPLLWPTKDHRRSKVGVLVDQTVWALHEQTIRAALLEDEHKDKYHYVFVAPGENSKSFAEYQRVVSELLTAGLDRGSAIVAIGGGVVGDLAGFVAATFLRGIDIFHVPTTLLAMVDSSIGGKTAINTNHGKNLVGALWQPKAVLSDTQFLTTLPKEQYTSALGEIMKYGLLMGGTMWEDVTTLVLDKSTAENGGLFPSMVRRCVVFKAAIVALDEEEKRDIRFALNLGHTVGHAIEKVHSMSHGHAVALGLWASVFVSNTIGVASPFIGEQKGQHSLGLQVAHLCTHLGIAPKPWEVITQKVIDTVLYDKKRLADEIKFVCLITPGEWKIEEINVTDLAAALRKAQQN